VDLLSSITVESMNVFQWGVVIGASLVAALGDLRDRRIPNALTFPLLVVGLIWATWFGGLSGLAGAVGACLLLAGCLRSRMSFCSSSLAEVQAMRS